MIKCCIFDLDGTILNTITSITYFVNKVFEEHGIEKITEEECKRFVGGGAEKLIKQALSSKGIYDSTRVKNILREYISEYDANPLYLTAAYDGIGALLHSLKAKGIKLAVLSNKPDTAVKNIVDFFFPDIFDIALGGRDGIPLKPDPTVPREILQTIGVSNSETAWIGDTATDIETGKNIKVALNIGVLWGFRERAELENAGADVIVSSADEILGEIIAFDLQMR